MNDDYLTDQMILDFDDDITTTWDSTFGGTYTLTTPTSGSSTVTISKPHGTNILDQLSTDSFTVNSNWDRGTHKTETEKKLEELSEWQEEVNKKLAILQPNSELEEQWSELRELRERYVKLEKELIEKNKMWNILKD